MFMIATSRPEHFTDASSGYRTRPLRSSHTRTTGEGLATLTKAVGTRRIYRIFCGAAREQQEQNNCRSGRDGF
jgi:hypothetical protein